MLRNIADIHELYNAIQIRHVIITLTLTIIVTYTRMMRTFKKYIGLRYRFNFVMFNALSS